MCCRTTVYPLRLDVIEAVLRVGQFEPVYWLPNEPGVAVNWERHIAEEGAVVNASISGDALELSLSPAISVFAHHFGKRIAAGVYFEIAAKYAEKVNGEIIQRATVEGCRLIDQAQGLVVAHYPAMPLSYSRICAGFQAVILGDAAA